MSDTSKSGSAEPKDGADEPCIQTMFAFGVPVWSKCGSHSTECQCAKKDEPEPPPAA